MSDLTEEERTAIGQRLKEGRERAALDRQSAEAIGPAVVEPAGLDIRDPAKWQMKIRLHLEAFDDIQEAERWLADLRLIMALAGRVIRDQVYKRVTMRCFVCERPFKDGRPACEAGYYDADREFIKVYACDQSEYAKLLEAVKLKEDEVARQEERAEKAARQAAKDARSRVMRA